MYMALTTQLVEVLQDALDKAGHDVKVSSRPTTNEVEIACGLLGIRVSELFAGLEEESATTTATAEEMREATHASWCTSHKTDPDGADVCQHSVTVGDVTVTIEDSPSWPDVERRQIVPPEITDCDAQGAREMAAALLEAARLVEEGPCSSSS